MFPSAIDTRSVGRLAALAVSPAVLALATRPRLPRRLCLTSSWTAPTCTPRA